MNKYWGHFKTICKHKRYVARYCRKCGYFFRGLIHDMSKFSFVEFFGTGKYFQGNRSPIDAEKEEKGYSLGWQHHKGHNPHHWEYWLENLGTYENKPIKIPYKYVVEMCCDWIAAGIVYEKVKINENEPYHAPLKYFNSHLHERIFHPETLKLAVCFLTIIDKEGINSFCKVAKSHREYFDIEP